MKSEPKVSPQNLACLRALDPVIALPRLGYGKVKFLLYILAFELVSATSYGRPVCCAIVRGDKIFTEESQCSGNTGACCAAKAQPWKSGSHNYLLKSEDGQCTTEIFAEYLSPVEVCYGPTGFARMAPPGVGASLDAFTRFAHLEHAWLRTPNKEAGMGPRAGTRIGTEWTNHSGFGAREGSHCHAIPGCDLECVEGQIQLGAYTGIYNSVTNSCHDTVVSVLKNCGCYDACQSYEIRGHVRGCFRWIWPSLGKLGLKEAFN